MLRSENACHDKGLEPRTTAALSAGLNRAHAATDAPAIERERPVFDDVTITFTERTPVSACGLTFELSGRQRQGAWAARRMIDSKSLAAQVLCRWRSALERRVRPQRWLQWTLSGRGCELEAWRPGVLVDPKETT
jgi:hypothetical protein